jgi:hypothetical protein
LIELLGVAGDTYFQEWDKSGNDEVAEAAEDDAIEMEDSMVRGRWLQCGDGSKLDLGCRRIHYAQCAQK